MGLGFATALMEGEKNKVAALVRVYELGMALMNEKKLVTALVDVEELVIIDKYGLP